MCNLIFLKELNLLNWNVKLTQPPISLYQPETYGIFWGTCPQSHPDFFQGLELKLLTNRTMEAKTLYYYGRNKIQNFNLFLIIDRVKLFF